MRTSRLQQTPDLLMGGMAVHVQYLAPVVVVVVLAFSDAAPHAGRCQLPGHVERLLLPCLHLAAVTALPSRAVQGLCGLTAKSPLACRAATGQAPKAPVGLPGGAMRLVASR